MIDICLKHGTLRGYHDRICEIGSWYPYTTLYWKMHNSGTRIDLYDIICREIAEAIPYDVDGVKLIDFNLCLDKYPDIQYDLVILSEVIEHLPINLIKFQDDVIKLIKPGGVLLVTYPLGGRNAKNYDKEYPERDFTKLQEDHVREFTGETVKLFFNELTLIDQRDVTYPAYGLITICLYQR
jgi:SAM-dependent methyltransferase